MGIRVLKLDMLFFGRRHHVAMDAGKILEGVQFRDERAFCRARRRRQKHHFHGILPVIDQLFGQLIAAFGPLLDIVDDGRCADKISVESANHFGIGEQTCSQVGATGSAALVAERPPGDDGENRPAQAARPRQGLIDRHPEFWKRQHPSEGTRGEREGRDAFKDKNGGNRPCIVVLLDKAHAVLRMEKWSVKNQRNETIRSPCPAKAALLRIL